MSVALNCNTHTSDDVDVIGNLIRVRLKTKPLANHYISCIKYVPKPLFHSFSFFFILFHSFSFFVLLLFFKHRSKSVMIFHISY